MSVSPIRLELVYTPKHGSWLNIAEIELSVFSRQDLNRRIPDLETLQSEAEAWQEDRNKTAKRVEWRFKTQDARIKRKDYTLLHVALDVRCVFLFLVRDVLINLLRSRPVGVLSQEGAGSERAGNCF